MFKFEVGKRYFARSIGDHNCIWTFEVLKRTEKTITIKDIDGSYSTRSRRIDTDGKREYVLPLGRYSFAPVLGADNIAEA